MEIADTHTQRHHRADIRVDANVWYESEEVKSHQVGMEQSFIAGVNRLQVLIIQMAIWYLANTLHDVSIFN